MMEQFSDEVKKYVNVPYFRNIHVFDSVSSTMDVAKKYAFDDNYDKHIFIALSQTSGMGTNGRKFFSPEGGLYMSILFTKEDTDDTTLTLRTAVAVKRAVKEIAGIDAGIKWVNDIMYDGKKLSGIIAKSAYMGMNKAYTIIGVGININEEEIPEEEKAISMKMITGENYSVLKIAASLINNMGKCFYEEDPVCVLNEYSDSCTSIGDKIKFIFMGEMKEGIITDISENGGIIVFSEGVYSEILSRCDVVEFINRANLNEIK